MIGRTKNASFSLYQVGLPSKHAQNEDEKQVNSNNSTKLNIINEQIRAICLQESAPPGYKHNLFQAIMNGVFKEKRHNNMWNQDWHDSSIITNRGKKA